jgi:hypothetical protein
MRPSAHVASSYGIKRESNTAGWHWPQKSRRAGISFAVLFNLICAIQHCGSWTQPKISYRSVDVRNRIVSSTRIGLKRPQLEYLQATTTLVLRGGEDTQRGDAADGATALTGELAEEVLKALECSTCMELMFEPVTLACGRLFYRSPLASCLGDIPCHGWRRSMLSLVCARSPWSGTTLTLARTNQDILSARTAFSRGCVRGNGSARCAASQCRWHSSRAPASISHSSARGSSPQSTRSGRRRWRTRRLSRPEAASPFTSCIAVK